MTVGVTRRHGDQFADLGFELIATGGTAAMLEKAGLKVRRIFKLSEGRPNAVDLLKNREIQIVINTPSGATPLADGVQGDGSTVTGSSGTVAASALTTSSSRS